MGKFKEYSIDLMDRHKMDDYVIDINRHQIFLIVNLPKFFIFFRPNYFLFKGKL